MTRTRGTKPNLLLKKCDDVIRDLPLNDCAQLVRLLGAELERQAGKSTDYKQQSRMRHSIACYFEAMERELNFAHEFDGDISKPTVAVGYHGTIWQTAEEILERAQKKDPTPFRRSDKEWDWLGSGVYFWLMAPHRAAVWAREAYQIERSQKPWLPNFLLPKEPDYAPPPVGRKSHFAVVEARIRLFPERTLNLLDTQQKGEMLSKARDEFEKKNQTRSEPDKSRAMSNYSVRFAQDTGEKRRKEAIRDPEGIMRTRDCIFHNELFKEHEFFSIIAAFREGEQIVPGVNIWDNDHVQINVIEQSIIDVESVEAHDAEDYLSQETKIEQLP